jgi:NitT/TauT family transport system substrate-binding protein
MREDLMQHLRTLAFSLSAMLGVACAMQAHAADLEKSSVHLAVGGKTLVAYLPLTIAERRGYFIKEGLQVEISNFQGGAKALEALVGGSADIVCGAYEHTLYMAAKGLSIKAIALQANSFGLVVGVQKDKAPTYQSLRDLKGMKIGVTGPGSASAIGLKMLLNKAGLTVDDVSIIGVGGGGAAVAAVKTGRLDAIANFDPVISLLERDGAIKTILDTRRENDLKYLYGAPFAASAFYIDARFVERYPKTTQAFVNAISSALAWMNKASTDEIVDAVPPEYFAGDRALYRVMVESNRARVSPDGRISPEAANITYRNLAAFEETFKDAKIDVSKTYDNSFVERAPGLRSQ